MLQREKQPKPPAGEAVRGPRGSGLLGHDYKPRARGALAGRFLVPPFSVLNAREGDWQERKRAWLSLGIRSELGRGENLLKFSDSVLAAQSGQAWGKQAKVANPNDDSTALRRLVSPNATPARLEKAKQRLIKARVATAIPGGDTGKNSAWLFRTEEGNYATNEDEGVLTGTSIFDPVLCEIVYRWFGFEGAHVLDPFAGGSVRGIVAGELGLQYTGIDLSARQAEANEKQAEVIGTTPRPCWLVGDSRKIGSLVTSQHYDLIFSCPPYGHLEVYSDDPNDISGMSPEGFSEAYREIILESCKLLKPGRFACFVVGDYRDDAGYYCNLPGQTYAFFEEAGLKLYNQIILVTAIGSLPMRINKQFLGSRKAGNTHQYCLVFAKGQPKDFVKTWPGNLLEKEVK